METLLAQIMSDLKIIKNSDNYRSPVFNPVDYAEHAFNKCLDLQQKIQNSLVVVEPVFEYFHGKTVRTHWRNIRGELSLAKDTKLWLVNVTKCHLKLSNKNTGGEIIYPYKDFKVIIIKGEPMIQYKRGGWILKICEE